MPESSLEAKNAPSSFSRYRMSPARQFSRSSPVLSLPLPRNPYNMLSAFCTEDNVPECLSYINKELCSLGLASLSCPLEGGVELGVVAVLNSMYDLMQLQRHALRSLENLEVEQLRSSSNLDYLQLSNTKLKDQLELSKRENSGLVERERQLQLKVKSLQNCLKNEKEEVQKLQNIIASRATQYNHDMKRKEREFGKLKERLNQLLIHKKEKKQAIELLNSIGRSDGKRSLWKTCKTEARHEGEMYATLLKDYDRRQKDLLVENAELKKVLQQMKGDMVSILSPRTQTLRGEKPEDGQEQVGSEEDEVFDSSRESLELSCEHAREKLTNSIRLQWRRLKSHVEILNSQASLVGDRANMVGERANMDAVPRDAHEEMMDRLKLEVQQCRDFIHTQQQLLQQQLRSTCDEETASLLTNCYMLQEKERLKDDRRAFDEQRTNLETERRNFTEAAIRLSHERKAFEEERASWLKHQFLNFTPFHDHKKPQMSKSQSALFVCAESEVGPMSTSLSHTTFSTPRAGPEEPPSMPDLHRARRIEFTIAPTGGLQESGTLQNGDAMSSQTHLDGGSAHQQTHLDGDSAPQQTHLNGDSAHQQTHLDGDSAHQQTHLDGNSAHQQTHLNGDSAHQQTHLDGDSTHQQTHLDERKDYSVYALSREKNSSI